MTWRSFEDDEGGLPIRRPLVPDLKLLLPDDGLQGGAGSGGGFRRWVGLDGIEEVLIGRRRLLQVLHQYQAGAEMCFGGPRSRWVVA